MVTRVHVGHSKRDRLMYTMLINNRQDDYSENWYTNHIFQFISLPSSPSLSSPGIAGSVTSAAVVWALSGWVSKKAKAVSEEVRHGNAEVGWLG